MSELANRKCIPCQGEVPALRGRDLTVLSNQLGNGWRCVEEHHIEKRFEFPDFRQALAFTNRVGALAEQQKHHPNFYLAWGKVILTLWTHKVDGLTESDFIFAAKVDQKLNPGSSSSDAGAWRSKPLQSAQDQVQRSADSHGANDDATLDLRIWR